VRTLGIALLVLLLLAAGGLYAVGLGVLGSHEEPGTPAPEPRPQAVVKHAQNEVAQAAEAIGAPGGKQVLFGDLHVHTTFSFDAFMFSLPLRSEGAHPPADACDFARFCSALDFWSINDHAEALTARHWQETVESIRQCNARAGDPAHPDTVAFLGWEWTQVGDGPEDHYGHKNVVLKDSEGEVPARPIAATATVERARAAFPGPLRRGLLSLLAPGERYHDFIRYLAERDGVPLCPQGVDVRELPPDCLETAATPADLFRKLDQWDLPSIVIPHGTTWGFYTPPGSSWDKQLRGAMHDPERQMLIEVYSGHGESEVHRPWRALEHDAAGDPVCPEPTRSYLPTCWRAGEIIRERCLAAGEGEAECERRTARARQLAAEAGHQAFLTVPGAQAEDWLDAGQCRDCDEPAFNYRPGGSAQYILALSESGGGSGDGADASEAGVAGRAAPADAEGAPEAYDDPRRFRMGFIASSDNHFARPGTGYKEVHRTGFTESGRRPGGTPLARLVAPPDEDPEPVARPFDRADSDLRGFQLFEFERQASFFLTGGLVGLYAGGRDHEAVWDALQRREVYGTSGPRILLWFELLNPPGTTGGSRPMGSEVALDEAPIFQARAVGSFEQLPGCPDYAVRGLGPAELERVCKGECWNPSDRRRQITRIEVVRIRPQRTPEESIASRVDDPWRVFACEPDPTGCAVTFADPEFPAAGRDALYYVRAYEEARPGINAGGVRCTRDAAGRCTEVELCPGPDGEEDLCLAPHEPRAWSSPIFVDWSAR